MRSVRQLFYLSRAVGDLSKSSIRQILSTSRQKNWGLHVTGCLLFSGRHFAQTLEGNPDILRELSMRIAADKRHTDFTVLLDAQVPERRYQDWSMGYVYNMDLTDRLEATLLRPMVSEAEAAELAALIVADSVLGPL